MRSFIDTNIFIYATWEKSPHFEKSRAFLKSCRAGSHSWYLSWGVVYEYLRVVTHSQVFGAQALSLTDALRNVSVFLQSPRVEIIQETSDHGVYLEQLTLEPQPVRGSLLHDAHLVVLMREHDIKKIVTADTDLHRFTGIDVFNPFS